MVDLSQYFLEECVNGGAESAGTQGLLSLLDFHGQEALTPRFPIALLCSLSWVSPAQNKFILIFISNGIC
jgi:hypothetical protein